MTRLEQAVPVRPVAVLEAHALEDDGEGEHRADVREPVLHEPVPRDGGAEVVLAPEAEGVILSTP